MSHTTTLKSVAIRDVRAMNSAVAELKKAGINCELLKDSKPRMYYSNQHGKCDFVLNLKEGQYDVGFEKQVDGTYSPVFDEWSNHISSKLGASCPIPSTPEGKAQHQIGRFMQAYSKNAAINAAQDQGYMVESANVDKAGNIQLVLTGY